MGALGNSSGSRTRAEHRRVAKPDSLQRNAGCSAGTLTSWEGEGSLLLYKCHRNDTDSVNVGELVRLKPSFVIANPYSQGRYFTVEATKGCWGPGSRRRVQPRGDARPGTARSLLQLVSGEIPFPSRSLRSAPLIQPLCPRGRVPSVLFLLNQLFPQFCFRPHCGAYMLCCGWFF